LDNTILIAADEPLVVKGLKFSLEQDGYNIDTAYDSEEALKKAGQYKYVLIIIDISSPSINGMSIYQVIREKCNTPVIVLTAKTMELHKVVGSEQGAYDYVTKPISIVEFKSKVKSAILRAVSKKSVNDEVIKLWDLTIDTISKSIVIGNREISLTSREYAILLLLARNKNRIYSREDLLEAIWGRGFSGDKRIVDVHIRRLREKLEANPSNPLYIITRWGLGYYFNG